MLAVVLATCGEVKLSYAAIQLQYSYTQFSQVATLYSTASAACENFEISFL